MSEFQFTGEVPASKSMMNRALLLQSFDPMISIRGDSDCDDVVHMRQAVRDFHAGLPMDCAEAGTALRFLAMRASRKSGAFSLRGTRRLLHRPQDEIVQVLQQLGVHAELRDDEIRITGNGWIAPKSALEIPRSRSSQFASGILLSAWDLPFDLELHLSGDHVSEGYWQMTLAMVRSLGMKVEVHADRLLIRAGQKLQAKEIEVEPDYSSLFSLVAATLVAGQIHVARVGLSSLQPDFIFFDYLKTMMATYSFSGRQLFVTKASSLFALRASLRGAPDLFPVLAVLCSFAQGTSILKEAPHLAHKESDRLKKTAELLRAAGASCKILPDGLQIDGQGCEFIPKDFVFDPDQDHRMAMAAGLYRLRNSGVQILTPEVVRKSYPQFWKVVGLA